MMKRWVWGLLVFSCVVSALAPQAQAARRQRQEYPPRYRHSSYSETVLRAHRNGKVTVHQVYPGYVHGFPPPAFLYYGYPHSGDGSGIGF